MQEFKLLVKELKNQPRFSLVYILTMFLGLVGLMIISNFNDSFKNALDSRSKNILTADMAIVARRPFQDSEAVVLKQDFEQLATEQTQMIEMYHMASKVDGTRSRLVQLKAVSPGYPLRGKVTTRQKEDFEVIFSGPKLIVDKDVLFQFKLEVGDHLKIGTKSFTIAAAIDDLVALDVPDEV